MPLSPEQIADYFRPPQHSFWAWQDQGNVLVWSDGATIAFRGELQPVVTRLAHVGLPPFGSIVLLLAACRDNWGAPPGRIKVLNDLWSELVHAPPGELFDAVMAELEAVHALPRELRAATAAKCEIAAMVFEASALGFTAAESAEIAQAFEAGLAQGLEGDNRHSALTVLLADLARLRDGLARVDAEALALRMRTGLEQTVVAAPLELDLVSQVRSVLSRMDDDEELAGLARLARLLMATVQLPRALSDPDDLPLGGVSDISNRGSLDRLLLSELAHDDLTLAVRVAVNEALYLRRESPPRTPPRQRCLLVDSGVRLWGVPRVFAAAVALAMGATADPKLRLAAFRASGKDAQPIDLASVEGFTDHLGALESGIHPGDALAALAERLSAHGEPADIVLVTSEDTLADRGFLQRIEQLALDSFHLATVSREGQFRLWQRSRRGGKLLREARFNLHEVLKPRPRQPIALIDEKIGSLPAIFGIDPFPLRLSCPVDAKNSWYVQDHGVLTYNSRGRLLLWNNPGLGGLQIETGLPEGELHWASTTATDGIATAVVGSLRPEGLHSLQIDLRNRRVTCTALRFQTRPRSVSCHLGTAYVVGEIDEQQWVEAASQRTGDVLASATALGLVSLGERYFVDLKGPREWAQIVALSFDGARLQFVPVEFTQHPIGRPIYYFSVQGKEGGMGLTPSGSVFDSGALLPVDHGLGKKVRLCGKSRDGHRVLLTQADEIKAGKRFVLLDMLTRQCRHIGSGRTVTLEPQLAEFARPRNLRGKILAIAIDHQRRLTLVGRRGHLWPLQLDRQHHCIGFPRDPEHLVAVAKMTPFESISPEPAGGIELRLAQWSDGSRAWLDPRGLLHLCSSSPEVPQCTIVLGDREMAGWIADGRTWGPRYFLGQEPTTSAEAAYEVLRQFIEQLP